MGNFFKNNIISILLIIVGIGFLLSAFDVIDFGGVILLWWPMLLIGLGLLTLMDKKYPIAWPIILLIAGGILQLNNLDIVNVSFWSVAWPIALIALGISWLSITDKPHQTADTIEVKQTKKTSSSKSKKK